MLNILDPARIASDKRAEFEQLATLIAAGLRRRYAEIQQEAEARGLRMDASPVYQRSPFQFAGLTLEVMLLPADGQVFFRLEEAGRTKAFAVDEPSQGT